MSQHKHLPIWLAFSLYIILLTVPLAFLKDLKPDNRIETFFEEDAPVRILENELRKEFPEDDILMLLLSGKNIYSNEFLEKFEKTIKELEKYPLIERVISVTTMDRIFGTEDGFSVEQVLKKSEVIDLTEEQRKQQVINDHFAPRRTASTDGSHFALVIRPYTLEASADQEKIRTYAQNVIDNNDLSDYIVAVAGPIEIELAMFKIMLSDNMRFMPATVILGVFLLWWMFRRFLVIGLVMLSIVVTVFSALMFVVLSGSPFSMPVSMVSPLLTSLTIAFYIHFFNTYLHASTRGYTGIDRINYVLDDIKRPLKYTALTTMAGLMSLGFNPDPPIQIFGFAATVGIAVLYFVTTRLLPPVLLALDKGNWRNNKSGISGIDHVVMFAARLSIRQSALVILATLVILLAGITQILKVQTETDMLLYFPEDHPIIKSDKLIAKEIAGTTSLEIIFDGEGRDSLKNPELLQEIKTIQTWIDALPEVDTTLSMVDIVEEMHWAFNSEDPEYRNIPQKREIISQYLFIYDGVDLYDLVNTEFDRARLQLNIDVHGARKIRHIMDKISKYINGQDITLKWQFAGAARMFSDHEKILIEGQFYSGIGAIVLIFLCLTIFWRSVKPAMLAILPNIAPVIFIFITMGILNISLDIGTAIVFSLAIGVAVDDTIHIYDSYLRRIQKGTNPLLSLVRSYRTAGRAITSTTIILCGQFFFLAFSSFIPTYQFGLMTGVGLLAALLFDILLLPAILALGIRLEKKKTALSNSQ